MSKYIDYEPLSPEVVEYSQRRRREYEERSMSQRTPPSFGAFVDNQAGAKMSQPTKDDPFGERPDPTSFAEMMEQVIDARIAQAWRSRAITKFQGIPDGDLVAELLARGWAVFKPKVND